MKIGLTGGIASGKSSAASCFQHLGITVIDADQIARQLLATGQPLLAELVSEFGPEVLDSTGALDRDALRRRVFESAAERQKLDALTHPAILTRLAEQAEAAQGPYVILEIPLLVETGADQQVDRVLVVDCAPGLQLARLVERDALDPQLARRMLAAQASRETRLQAADDVILNDSGQDELRRMVAGLDGYYRRLIHQGCRDG